MNSKRALVTGATSGIGFETARQLVGQGWEVMGVARTADTEKVPQGVVPYKADLLQDGAAQKIIEAVQKTWGGLDLLVNNAGGSWVGYFQDMPTQDLDRVFGLNVRAVMLMCRESIALLKSSDHGHIINVASIAAHLPMETLAAYCASKAALIMFSKVLAKELSGQNIRVTAVSPCGTDTNIFNTVGVEVDKEALVPPEDMAWMIVMLTRLPESVDVSELQVNKRFQIYV